jgi:hypothetical protein
MLFSHNKSANNTFSYNFSITKEKTLLAGRKNTAYKINERSPNNSPNILCPYMLEQWSHPDAQWSLELFKANKSPA